MFDLPSRVCTEMNHPVSLFSSFYHHMLAFYQADCIRILHYLMKLDHCILLISMRDRPFSACFAFDTTIVMSDVK